MVMTLSELEAAVLVLQTRCTTVDAVNTAQAATITTLESRITATETLLSSVQATLNGLLENIGQDSPIEKRMYARQLLMDNLWIFRHLRDGVKDNPFMDVTEEETKQAGVDAKAALTRAIAIANALGEADGVLGPDGVLL